MACYTSHIDFIRVAQETFCSICKHKCERNEEMGKHVCGCGCVAFDMSCMCCPIGAVFQPIRCRKELQQPSNVKTKNEFFLTKMKKKQLKKKTIFFYFYCKNYLKGKNNEKSSFCLASSSVVQTRHRLIQSVFVGIEQY